MRTVGEILQVRRLQKKLQVEDVARAIKAKGKFVAAIESNDFSPFMDEVFALGFVRDYAEFLGINPEEITPFFRRTWEIKKKRETSQNSFSEENFFDRKLHSAGKNISAIIIGAGTIIILTIFIIFLIAEYRTNIIRPQVTIINPASDVQVNTESMKIKGKTDIENKVYIDGVQVDLNSQGEFSTIFELKKGLNKIKISVVNKHEKETLIERLVYRK